VLFSVDVVVDGDIRVNGRPLGDYMHRLSGFMHQDDLFLSTLTVQEHLNFMVRTLLFIAALKTLGSCGHCNDPSGSVKREEILDYLSDY
jgi:hypothetical protein